MSGKRVFANQQLIFMRDNFRRELDEVELQLSEEKHDLSMSLDTIKFNRQLCRYNVSVCPDTVVLLERQADLIATISSLEHKIARTRRVVAESFTERKELDLSDPYEMDADPDVASMDGVCMYRCHEVEHTHCPGKTYMAVDFDENEQPREIIGIYHKRVYKLQSESMNEDQVDASIQEMATAGGCDCKDGGCAVHQFLYNMALMGYSIHWDREKDEIKFVPEDDLTPFQQKCHDVIRNASAIPEFRPETIEGDPLNYHPEVGVDPEWKRQDRRKKEKAKRKKKKRQLNSEMMDEGAVDSGSVDVRENLTDVVGDPTSSKDVGRGVSLDIGRKNLLSISDFFRRPIHIDSFDVKVGDDISAVYKIWDIYSLAPTVRAKFRNYSYFTGNLCVQIEVSGSPFHFGKALISYQPFAIVNDNLNAHLANVTASALARPSLLNYLSQATGAITIDYRGNRPVMVKCPFISPKGMHRLWAASAAVLAAATSYPDFADAGSLYIYSTVPVQAIGTAPTPISFHIYAWLEDVELGPPTATQIDISTEGMDERKTGPVERISSSAASALSLLSEVPSIGPFAMASSYIMRGVSGLASIFGWSRPLLPDSPQFVKNRPYCNTSNTIGSETSEKLSFDPKQELCVDPSVVASSKDEMALAHIAGVVSLLEKFAWATGAPRLATPLWESRVTPLLDTYYTVAALKFYQPTALSFSALPFLYWRGTIKFRFEIMCSQYHRGKLAFYYEPNLLHGPIIDTAIALNKNYLKLVDIQETQDIEFCINYAQPYMWLKNNGPGGTEHFHGSLYDTTTAPTTGYNNGYIAVVPFTDLESPDGSTIYINVYVSGEDMQYNLLSAENLPTARKLVGEGMDEKGADSEVSYSCFDLNESSGSNKGVSEYCFGEQVLSFRSCLKRYVTTHAFVTSIGAVAHKQVSWTLPMIIPVAPAYHTTGATPTIASYLPYAYLGVKGGMRKRIRAKNEVSNNALVVPWQVMDAINIQLGALDTADITDTAVTLTNTQYLLPQKAVNTFIPNTNGGVEIELPYYSPNLFHFSFGPATSGVLGSGSSGIMTNLWHRNYVTAIDHCYQGVNFDIVEDSAIAEDFNFMRFCGAPFYTA